MRIIVILLVISIALSGCGASDNTRIRTDRVPEARNIYARLCDDPVKTRDAADIIEGVLSRFQTGLLTSAGIEAIYICEGLTSFDIPVPAASIRSEGKTYIYVDASAPRRIDVSFTHELFHAFEFKHPVNEGAWAQINPYESYPFDTAEPGEIIPYTPNMTPAFEPGFVSDYARFSGMEDRAELFSVLYSGRNLSAKERTAMLCDLFLMEKIEFIKDYMKSTGLVTEDMDDNLFKETYYSCRAYSLVNPEFAYEGPGKPYPAANLKAGQLLADSGFEKDGFKMLYDCAGGYKRVYAPPSAIEPLDDERVTIILYASPR